MKSRPRVTIRPAATRDLDAAAAFIAQSDREAGARFLHAFETGLATLVEFPEIGSPYGSPHPPLRDLRCWRLPAFENWLVFYTPKPGAIEIVRVLHTSRDVLRILRR